MSRQAQPRAREAHAGGLGRGSRGGRGEGVDSQVRACEHVPAAACRRTRGPRVCPESVGGL